MQFLNNIRAIEELSKSNPDIEVLTQYRGFGGLKNDFYNKQYYARLMSAIRANFGRDEQYQILNSLKNSTSSAYYTPMEIIKFMYSYLIEVCKFKGGNILEPSCGIGDFFKYMPKQIVDNSNLTAIEYDLLTAKIAQSLYSNVDVIQNGLQFVDTNKKFDLIIGNPPYSYERVQDNKHPDISGYTIHHYFIARCLRMLKPDGLLAFVMPSFFMDIPRANTRHIINNEAVVIDVFRLPDNLFSNATVTVDLMFLRKTGNKLHDISRVRKFTYDGNVDSINNYWYEKPKHIIGQLYLKWVKPYKRYVPCCRHPNSEKLMAQLKYPCFSEALINNFAKII